MMNEVPAVLVVDDNEFALETMAELLTLLGFKAHTARDGFEATEKLVEYGKLHTLLSDINLPNGIDGLQLARAVRATMPDVNIVLCSGLSLDRIRRFPAYESDYRILQKPISLAELKHVLQPLPELP